MIEIPFREEFREPMLEGRKTCTSRNRRYGEPGDRFVAFDATFELTAVFQAQLEYVACVLWQEEGVSGPEHFKRVWTELHPRKGWAPEQVVWVHKFRGL